jgi:hypothetical protein
MSNFHGNDQRGVITANNYQTGGALTKERDDDHPEQPSVLRAPHLLFCFSSRWCSLGHNSAAGRVGVTKFYSSLNLELRDARALITHTHTHTRFLTSTERERDEKQQEEEGERDKKLLCAYNKI